MNLIFKHIPVMKKKLIESLQINQNGIYIDSTFGMGGHSFEILKRLEKKGKIYALDKDPESIFAGNKIQDARFKIINTNFSQILHIAKQENIIGKVNGIFFDLGVSSPQIDNPQRGFSFISDGPLDMRMNPYCGISAADWLFKSNINQIASVLKEYGEEKFSKRIANAIYYQNKKKKITRTVELARIIQKANPINNKFKHPARRTFQAIRIYINQELSELQRALDQTLKILKPGGRISIISFHSLEDRIVKNFMLKNSKRINIPYGMPITEKQLISSNQCKLKMIDRIFPNIEEIQKNPRSRSAILRIAELKNT